MTQLFVGNFEFEHQLAAREQAAVPRTADELASVWLSLAQAKDVLWMPQPPEADFAREMAAEGFPNFRWASSTRELGELREKTSLACRPWGWSPQVVKWAEEQNLCVDSPPLEAVRTANSRRFSFALEREWKVALDHAEEIPSLDKLSDALKVFAGDASWVLKSEFGMSARERMLGRGPELTINQIGWARKRLLSGQALILEPWVRSLGEAGLQFEVPKPSHGTPRFLGITPMFTDASGVYRGSRFDGLLESGLDWSEAVTIGQCAAERVQDLGYFGPLGLDAMWYLDETDTARLRPLQDLNARWTMGRLSLGFCSQLGPDESGAWLHLRCPAKTPHAARDWWESLKGSLPQGARLLRTSPITIGGQVTQHTTAVLITGDPGTLEAASLSLLAIH